MAITVPTPTKVLALNATNVVDAIVCGSGSGILTPINPTYQTGFSLTNATTGTPQLTRGTSYQIDILSANTFPLTITGLILIDDDGSGTSGTIVYYVEFDTPIVFQNEGFLTINSLTIGIN